MINTTSLALAACATSLALVLTAEALAAPLPLVNPGFESRKPGVNDNPEGWGTFQHAGPVSFDFALDSGEKRAGTQSMRVKRIGPEVYGSVTQVVPAGPYAGRTVRLTVWMKTEVPAPEKPVAAKDDAKDAAKDEAKDGAGRKGGSRRGGRRDDAGRGGAAMMLIALRGTSILESEMMTRDQVRGTTPWTKRSIELAIPKQATHVEIGAMLQGVGTMWVDDFELEVLDR